MKIQIKIKYACGCEETKEVEMRQWIGVNPCDTQYAAEIELDDCAGCAHRDGQLSMWPY